MLAGSNAITFGLQIPSSNHKQVIADGCVSCHMATTPAAGQPGSDYVGEHSFAMRWVNPNNSTQIVENVAVCQPCHGAISSFADIKAKEDFDGDGVIESAQDEVKGLLAEIGKLLPPLGDLTVTVTADYTPVQLKAAYNYLFVNGDGSDGLHNFQYAIHLLQAAHHALTSGDIGAGAITAITDVPDDQGKQVQITWTRFGGDGLGNNPIKFYALWRRVDQVIANSVLQKNPVHTTLASLPTELAQFSNGLQVVIDEQLWDFVGSSVAVQSEQYRAIAPTLYDSTKFAGVRWSVFRISGHSNVPALTTVSAPDSGYSIDNLPPAAPTNLHAVSHRGTAILSWDKSTDEDFKYFVIYRGLSAGFNPIGATPLAMTSQTAFTDVNVTIGTSYFYRITAVDFAGNESAVSSEVTLLVTAVAETTVPAVPSDWVLAQNYPNPFNPTTEITFGLPKTAQVLLVVYNALGAQVRILAQNQFSAGYHTMNWDGCNEAGQEVGPGIYFYRLTTPATTLTQKMILLK